MHWAVKRENYELMEILYQNGADLHALDIVHPGSYFPLMLLGLKKTIRYCKENTKSQDYKGNFPLLYSL